MEISSVMVMTIAVILILAILVFTLEMYLPLQVKTQMYGLCRPYIFKIESQGKLSDVDYDELTATLEAIGLNNISINISDENKSFGDIFDIQIKGSYIRSRLISLFVRKDENLEMIYERQLVYRKISN